MVDLSERFDCFQLSIKDDTSTVIILFCHLNEPTLKKMCTYIFCNSLIYVGFNLRVFFYRNKSIISFTQHVLTSNPLNWTDSLSDWQTKCGIVKRKKRLFLWWINFI